MRFQLSALMIATLLLSGCGAARDSRLNPFNWFGRNAPDQTAGETANPLIPRRESIFRPERKSYRGTPVNQILSMTVERTVGGVIVKVSGLPLRQGAFDVRLTSDTEGEAVDGVLTFTLKALQPVNRPQGNQNQRIVTAATFVTDQQLQGVSTIRVLGASNATSSRL